MEKAHVDVKAGNAILRMYTPQNIHRPLEIKLIDLKNKIEESVKAKLEAGIPKLQAEIAKNEKNLQICLDRAVKNINPKLLKEALSLNNISDLGSEEEIKAKLINGYKYDAIKWLKHHNNEANTLAALTRANQGLNTAIKYLEDWKLLTTEKYLSLRNIQIKTFTNNKGEKETFDIYDGADRFSGSGYVAPRAEAMNL